ncbi:PEGA domain-containing protein, partial [Corallococcus sicarius]
PLPTANAPATAGAPSGQVPAAAVPATPPPAAPREVRFRVESEPAGAEVTINGHVRGKTPLEIVLPPDESGLASLALTFALEGYQTVSKTYAGEPGSTVPASMKLPQLPQSPRIKKQGPKPKAPGSAYKDDPYQ